MDIKRNVHRGISLIMVSLIFLVLFSTDSGKQQVKEYVISETEILGQELEWELICSQLPVFRYLLHEKNEDNGYEQFVVSFFPIYQYLMNQEVLAKAKTNRMEMDVGAELAKGILEENAPTNNPPDTDRGQIAENVSPKAEQKEMHPEKISADKESNQELEVQGQQEDTISREEMGEINGMETVGDTLDTSEIFLTESDFSPVEEKRQEFDWETYTDMEKVRKDFFAIDATTEIEDDRIHPQRLLEKEVALSEGNGEPQILIYHTHSQETFADSIPGDSNTSIVGAGEYLAGLLKEKYGFEVLHHTGEYDVETRDYAYSYALPNIEAILQEYPSIEVVIDLHRDAVAEGTKLVSEQNGKTAAQVMFFNGLSHTKKQGDIEYLENPYIDDNLAFSFQMQVLCNEYYPGLTRRIYLKGYRYNMHLCSKSLLVELGAQTNTCEEVRNTLDILAHVLSMCLTGET